MHHCSPGHTASCCGSGNTAGKWYCACHIHAGMPMVCLCMLPGWNYSKWEVIHTEVVSSYNNNNNNKRAASLSKSVNFFCNKKAQTNKRFVFSLFLMSPANLLSLRAQLSTRHRQHDEPKQQQLHLLFSSILCSHNNEIQRELEVFCLQSPSANHYDLAMKYTTIDQQAQLANKISASS